MLIYIIKIKKLRYFLFLLENNLRMYSSKLKKQDRLIDISKYPSYGRNDSNIVKIPNYEKTSKINNNLIPIVNYDYGVDPDSF